MSNRWNRVHTKTCRCGNQHAFLVEPISAETAETMSEYPTSVLTTVNAPYSRKLDAQELAYCLTHPAAAQAAPGQMSAFFGEVAPELQKEFARAFAITDAQLAAAAKTFAAYSGETYPLAS